MAMNPVYDDAEVRALEFHVSNLAFIEVHALSAFVAVRTRS